MRAVDEGASELERERLCCVEYDSLSLSLSLPPCVSSSNVEAAFRGESALGERQREREREAFLEMLQQRR